MKAYAIKKKSGGIFLYTVAGSARVAKIRFIENFSRLTAQNLSKETDAEIDGIFNEIDHGQSVVKVNIDIEEA
jgi:hypothetical protein